MVRFNFSPFVRIFIAIVKRWESFPRLFVEIFANRVHLCLRGKHRTDRVDLRKYHEF